MSDVLERDAATLHRAIRHGNPLENVQLHQSTIQYLAGVLDARLLGGVAQHDEHAEEVAPTKAAELLGVSRPHVRRLMDEGTLPFRMVGTHHRIPLEAVTALREAERASMADGMAALSRLQDELGLSE
ncbi:DNA binding domain protein, excisionase family [Xylanimonas cellulosilytica DSM 15894]|uniref:DNA binding domain protein, excisionase family n=1 Tax=Xylanimonas cellulosilytica (strain DSM 15894 / JCM 12276 / CECT 5975 / KCTC 9989 / LMG 20990 / NBRC 107835 / XIL07) TaxID=446471 RepID=D1BY39_XYLCX|nr:excisionase family DNA-binding protein [Xylanimonas cellulosilytica]ACZ29882.1 DNA binding domain protein, excisionase family [Xylanimonas cellulosilytica DSM 15894]